MKRFVFKIGIVDPDYIDQLIVSLTHQGYAPYFGDNGDTLCINISEDELEEIEVYNNFMDN